MTQFRIKKIDTGLPDEWVLRTNDDGATLGDDIVAEDPNDLAAALVDTQALILKASVYSPASLIDPAHGILERIKIIEDGVGTTTLQSAYANGNYINPTPGQNLILGAGGVVEIDSGNNLMLNPTTMKIYSGSQQLDFTKSSITTSTTNLTLGTTGATRDLTVQAGNEMYLKDKYLLAPVRLSQSGSPSLTTTAQSLVGAINEIRSGATSASFQQIYTQSSPPKILTTLSGGKFIVENGTGNPLTPAMEVSGNLNVTGENKSGSIKVGPGITVNTSIDTSGLITTAGNIITSGELRSSTVRAPIGSLTLADTFGSAQLATNIDPILTTTKQSLFGAINELRVSTTASASALAAFGIQHDSSSGLHKIITTRSESAGVNGNDRFLLKNDVGTDVIRMNALGVVRANNIILPAYDLGAQALLNETHRAGDGTDHSAFASHIAAANPHNTVKHVQAQGSPLLTGTVILKAGPGATLTQSGNEIEISAAAGSTLQGVYDTQPTGAFVLSNGKELFFKDVSNIDVASFEQTGSYFYKTANFRNSAGISSNNNLLVETSADLTLRSTGSNIVASTPSGSVTIQGVQFAPNGIYSVPAYLPATLADAVYGGLGERYATYTNATHETIPAGTTVSVNTLGQLWTPTVNANLISDEYWLGSAMGITISSIAPGASGQVKLGGTITANIGEMDATADGDFQIGDTLYVARQGYAEVEFTGAVANNSTITVDATGTAVVFTAVLSGALPSARKFTIDSNTDIMVDRLVELINDPLSMATYSGISFRAYSSGVKASADAEFTANATVGDTFTINASTFFGTSVVLTAVAAGTKTTVQQFEVASTLLGTVRNLVDTINDTSRLRADGNTGHLCVAEFLGTTFRIHRKDNGPTGANVVLTTTSASITTPSLLTGGKSFARIYMLNRNASGKTMATSAPGTIRVANFTSDETTSQYIAARYLFAYRRKPVIDEKIIKVGKVLSIAGVNTTIKIEIEDRDVFKN